MIGDCRCPTKCGRPVYLAKSYAPDCPWRAEQAIDRKRKANERYRRKKGMSTRMGRPPKPKTCDDISDEEIDRRFEQALADQRRARQTGQAA